MSSEDLTNTTENKKPIFRNIDADDADPETTEIESACMNCFRSGQTRLLLTKIPFFKEVVLMSFKCEHCGFESNEIQSASEIQKKGVRIELSVKNAEDLNRRVVRSDYTSVSIPEVELEIPSQSQKGEITTVEGIIARTIRGLTQDQEVRKIEHPEAAASIDAYIHKLNSLRELKSHFTLILEDISGNIFVENPFAPSSDPNCKIIHFERQKDQDRILGLYSPEDSPNADENDHDDESSEAQKKNLLKPIAEDAWGIDDLNGEVLQFQTLCQLCGSSCETNMKLTKIPHFKEVVIMATVCETCGCKTNEVKCGGGIEEMGIRFEVRVENKEDFSRDVLKSETCSLKISELDCEVGPSALGGRFTTVEGILVAMKDQLQNEGCLFRDSADDEIKNRLESVIDKFDQILASKLPVTLILDDPAGNSYVQSLAECDEIDSNLIIEKYERSFDQNEELGLNDIKTEDY
ncbi:zinc finger protein ZPR1 [Anastrepha ludens]|uniref:zinc finger protein ZPR1 n=1 Tax=Anastrepha ludens TaxID=28586 RepID=UPI0023AF8536|nr:zinc finger protein ZPR1 [Anastrepha ludens]